MAFKVLIFDGRGICRDSIDGLLRDLRSYLHPNYGIGAVDQTELQSGTWAHTCACLVLPHCDDVGVYKRLGQDAGVIKQIRDFVQNGKSFLGIGGGAFFASAQANWNGRSIWTTPLALWPGTSNGPCFLGGAHVHDLNVNIDGSHCYMFWKDGGEFMVGTSMVVLAQYNDNESVAGIHYAPGKGNVVLWHARLEHTLTPEVFRDSGMPLSTEKIEYAEQCRLILFERTLQTLHLEPIKSPQPPEFPFPQLLVAHPVAHPNPENVFGGLWDLSGDPPLFKDATTTFEILPPKCATPQEWVALKTQSQSSPHQLIWVVSPHRIPPAEVTPLFNIESYFRELAYARGTSRVSCELGRSLLYGQAVTSTHSQLIGNPLVAKKLPSPLLSLATFQLEGIGSSSNSVWHSPYGVLQWTLMLDVPNGFGHTAHLDAAVHIVSLAVVEACRPLLDVEHRHRLGLKWPNDIYIDSGAEERLEKVGGVLVELIPETNTDGTRRILIGCGLDVCNSRPLPALQQFADPRYRDGKLPMELVAARIMAQLSIAWEQFSANGFSFAPFRTQYTDALLHKGWNARLRTRNGNSIYQIKGVDNDGRLWIAHPQSGGDLFLPANGFSFDIYGKVLFPRGQA